MDLIDLFVREVRTRQIKKRSVLAAFFLMMANAAAWILILDLLSQVVEQEEPGFGFDQFSFLLSTLLLYLITNLASKRKVAEIFEDLIFNIRQRLIGKVKGMEQTDFEAMGAAKFYNLATLDLRYISDIGEVFWFLAYNIILTLGVLAYIANISFPVFAMVVAVQMACVLGYLGLHRILQKRVQKARNAEGSLFEVVQSLLFGFKELAINRAKKRDFYDQAVLGAIQQVRDARIQVGRIRAEAASLIGLSWVISLFLVIFVVPLVSNLPAAEIYRIAAAAVFMPFAYLMNDVNLISFSSISVARVYEFEESLAKRRQVASPRPLALAAAPQTYALQNLKYSYTDPQGETSFELGPLDLKFAAGQISFIVGGNGSGKSTLLKLLVGLYPQQQGQILLDGRPLEYGQQRQLFACVFTDFHLFQEVQVMNQVDPERVQRLLVEMELDQKVSFRAGRFSSLDLSTGQKKRLALVVALLEDKPFYIFDEWAADQSPEFRDHFYRRILPSLKEQQKLVICITHDDHYFHLADELHRLEMGQLLPQPTRGGGQGP